LPSWILAIDFGTSYTVAASKIGDRAPEVIEVGGERRMPSVIMIDPTGSIVVGRTADDLSGTHPGSTLRALKNRLGDQAPVVLDGRPYQVVNLVAALLKSVYTESVRQMGEVPSEVRLTHPATWNRPRLNRLLEAAAKAELPAAALVPEPVAAALSFASEVGVAQGAHVVVYDLGGGTFDSAVVTASGGGFNIVGRPSGDQNIGGELFDELIVNHLGEQLPPDAWDAIQIGEEPLWQQVGATLRNEARRAKETLSGNPYADLIVPLPSGLKQIRLTREVFEELVKPYIAETVVLLARCVQEAGLEPSQLSGISLVGGSSRSPIVERMVKEAFPDVPVIRRGDPKTAVASGAARAVRSSVTSLPSSPGRVTQEAAAGTAQESPRLAPPNSQPSVPPPHTSQPSVPPAPPPSLPPTSLVSPGPTSQPPVAVAPSVQPVSLVSESAVATKSSKKPLLMIIAAVVVVAVVVAVLLVVRKPKGAAAQPTRKVETAAMVTIRQVRDAFGSDWNAEDLTGASDPFCPQFILAEPLRSVDALYTSVETGDNVSNAGFYENISSFDTAGDASKFYDQDTAISRNCAKSEGHLGTLPVTYVITDVTNDADAVGREVVAVKYEASPTDGSTGVLLTGYIVEARIGRLIMSTNYYVYNRDPEKSEINNYYDLTKIAFDKAVAAL
jgi:actin-like ATPase involved in cell morphogenesis